LALTLPRLVDDAERKELIGLAGEVSRRIEAEIAEEGGVSLDLFDETRELRDIERGLEDVGYKHAPESVSEAVATARRRAGTKPSSLARGAAWGLALAVLAAAISLAFALLAGLVALILVPLGTYLGWRIGAGRYRWGTASVSRVGLEAWTRGYAEARGMTLQDRWRFHATHRDLPMPGFADHVLSGKIPGSAGLHGRLLFLGDAAELRAIGQEVALTSERPLAATAIVVDAGRELDGVPEGLELDADYRLQVHGSEIMVWRLVAGNLLRTSAGTDRFCERAAGVVRSLI
jgi:hypothetical protein